MMFSHNARSLADKFMRRFQYLSEQGKGFVGVNAEQMNQAAGGWHGNDDQRDAEA